MGHAAKYAKQGVGFDLTRRVWAAISANPRGSKRALMHDLGIASSSTLYAALYRLERAGYIRHSRGAKSSWIVVIPFHIITKGV